MTPDRRRYSARFAAGTEDLRAAQRLRHEAFIANTAASPRADGLDADRFDAACLHVLIEEPARGLPVCTFRLLPLEDGTEIRHSYAAQFYDLRALEGFAGRMVEMGRFCILPGLRDPDVLRMAWSVLTRHVDENGVALLFGCSSFRGTEGQAYADAFALLRDRHLAPPRWRPKVKAPEVFEFASRVRQAPDTRRAMQSMPPLLRSYIAMGGWVSDHAVVDPDLDTLHVFTALEIEAIPAARARLLRATAG